MQVNFYETVEDKLLKFAVIISKYKDKWVYCKHKERDTYEIPGGHREENEDIVSTAKRELYEETGALDFELEQVCVYSVTGKNKVNESGEETYGMLFFADIKTFDKELHSEMEYIRFFDEMPTELTYPLIQPLLMKEYLRRKNGVIKVITVCGSYIGKSTKSEIEYEKSLNKEILYLEV